MCRGCLVTSQLIPNEYSLRLLQFPTIFVPLVVYENIITRKIGHIRARAYTVLLCV